MERSGAVTVAPAHNDLQGLAGFNAEPRRLASADTPPRSFLIPIPGPTRTGRAVRAHLDLVNAARNRHGLHATRVGELASHPARRARSCALAAVTPTAATAAKTLPRHATRRNAAHAISALMPGASLPHLMRIGYPPGARVRKRVLSASCAATGRLPRNRPGRREPGPSCVLTWCSTAKARCREPHSSRGVSEGTQTPDRLDHKKGAARSRGRRNRRIH